VALLLALLIVAVALSCVAGDVAMRAAAVALLVNWCANTAFVKICAEVDPWIVFLVVDYTTALLLIVLYKTNITRLICLTYAAQCVVHGSYGYVTRHHATDLAKYNYWWVLYYLALAQVAIVGGTIVYQRVGDWGRAGGGVPFDKSGTLEGNSESPRR
jgi:hypothetical protein